MPDSRSPVKPDFLLIFSCLVYCMHGFSGLPKMGQNYCMGFKSGALPDPGNNCPGNECSSRKCQNNNTFRGRRLWWQVSPFTGSRGSKTCKDHRETRCGCLDTSGRVLLRYIPAGSCCKDHIGYG